jgi:hypothetical protein
MPKYLFLGEREGSESGQYTMQVVELDVRDDATAAAVVAERRSHGRWLDAWGPRLFKIAEEIAVPR